MIKGDDAVTKIRLEVTSKLTMELHDKFSSFTGYGIYHTPQWHNHLKSTFGWNVKGIIGYHADQTPVLFIPFVSKLRLNKWENISLPLSHKVGIVYDPNYLSDADLFDLPIHSVLNQIEIRDAVNLKGTVSVNQNVTTGIDLREFASVEDYYSKLDYKRVRYEINRAERNNVRVVDNPTERQIQDFFNLVAETRHRQGTPLYPPKMFINLAKVFSGTDYVKLYLGYYQDIPVSANCFYYYGNCATYAYSASTNDKELKSLGSNEFVMWYAIQEAFKRQMDFLDFGTSPISLPGLTAFKEKWGGKTIPLPYTIYSPAKEVKGITRASEAIKLVSKILQKLPIPVCKFISP